MAGWNCSRNSLAKIECGLITVRDHDLPVFSERPPNKFRGAVPCAGFQALKIFGVSTPSSLLAYQRLPCNRSAAAPGQPIAEPIAHATANRNLSHKRIMIQIKRVYEAAAKTDGERFLVERLWPRGMKKETLQMTSWLKEVAPSEILRRWFNHDPAKWKEFQRRYRVELDGKPEAWQPLLDAAERDGVTLLFSAHDLEHNNAVALKAYLDKQLKRMKKFKSSAGK